MSLKSELDEFYNLRFCSFPLCKKSDNKQFHFQLGFYVTIATWQTFFGAMLCIRIYSIQIVWHLQHTNSSYSIHIAATAYKQYSIYSNWVTIFNTTFQTSDLSRALY